MTIYESVKTQQRAELVSETREQVVLRLQDTGEEKTISMATLKRWWKCVPMAGNVMPCPTDNKEEETMSETVTKEAKQPKVKKERAPKKESAMLGEPLRDYLENLAIGIGCTVFETQTKGFHTIKVDGNMCMALTYSANGINLWMRKKAIGDIVEAKYVKHMFDAHYRMSELTEENKELLRILLELSVKYQRDKKAAVKPRKAKAAVPEAVTPEEE